jgi:elongation factor Ts
MAAITAVMVKELRDITGTGMMECKKALAESHGDMEKAVDILKQKGLAKAAKRAGREASQGVIASYIHMDKLGVMVEVNCETDFVAKTDDFKTLARDIAMHVAAANPFYVTPGDVPEEVLNKEKDIYRAQIEGKPENVVEKILEGKVNKYYEEVCLTEQVFVKDPEGKKKVRDLITESIGRIGENILVRRFERFQLGEG